MFGLLLAMVTLMVSSCVGLQSNPESTLPGNKPAAWEGKSLGVPL